MQSIGIHLSDLVQLDEFIEHAQFHSKEYGDNVFVFISKHYGELKAEHDAQHKEEQEEHQQLPFQHHYHMTVNAFEADLPKMEFVLMDFPELQSSNFHYQDPFSTLHIEGLLQPPRFS